MLWNNNYTVSRAISQIAGATQLSAASYWSSSENDATTAWTFNFYSGSATNYGDKYYAGYVRAVRAF
jgi:hypothetical protein